MKYTDKARFKVHKIQEHKFGTIYYKTKNAKGTTIFGEGKVSFIQDKSIHYVLIPDILVDLVKSYFVNTFATDLWKGDNTGTWAYKTSHADGEYNDIHYKVYFYYSPSGGFDDPINLIVKNK